MVRSIPSFLSQSSIERSYMSCSRWRPSTRCWTHASSKLSETCDKVELAKDIGTMSVLGGNPAVPRDEYGWVLLVAGPGDDPERPPL